MQFPNTPETRTTEAIMERLKAAFPEWTTAEYNRAFSAVYDVLTKDAPAPLPSSLDEIPPQQPKGSLGGATLLAQMRRL